MGSRRGRTTARLAASAASAMGTSGAAETGRPRRAWTRIEAPKRAGSRRSRRGEPRAERLLQRAPALDVPPPIGPLLRANRSSHDEEDRQPGLGNPETARSGAALLRRFGRRHAGDRTSRPAARRRRADRAHRLGVARLGDPPQSAVRRDRVRERGEKGSPRTWLTSSMRRPPTPRGRRREPSSAPRSPSGEPSWTRPTTNPPNWFVLGSRGRSGARSRFSAALPTASYTVPSDRY